MKQTYTETNHVDELRNTIVNHTYLSGAVLVSLAFIAVSFRDYPDLSFNHVIQFIIMLVVNVFTIYRKSLSLKVKLFVMMMGLFVIITNGLFNLGVLASAKVYIVMVPVYMSFLLGYKKSLFTLLALISLYGGIGVLYLNGYLQYTVDVNTFVHAPSSWIAEGIIIFLSAFCLLYVGRYYRSYLLEQQKKVETQNVALSRQHERLEYLVKERTEELEASNEELMSSNDALIDNNKIISEQNEELSETMKQLKEAQSKLVQAEKMASLGVLTSGIAHEINNPLNYIHAGLYSLECFLEKEDIKDTAKAETIQDTIRTGVERATNIVSSLADFSRDNSNHNEKCDIHAILNNSLIMLENQLKHRVKVEKDYLAIPPIAVGNVGHLHQVMLNVISNAEQAIEKEGSIVIKTSRLHQDVLIEVSDSGTGIAPDILDKVVEPFFTTKEPGKGTGLGLSITYNIIKEHKGKLSFLPNVNNIGTIVSIQLPLFQEVK